MGFTQRQAVLTLYGLSVVMAVGAFLAIEAGRREPGRPGGGGGRGRLFRPVLGGRGAFPRMQGDGQ